MKQETIDSLNAITDYLETKEQAAYKAHVSSGGEPQNHIYAHVIVVRDWLIELEHPYATCTWMDEIQEQRKELED